MFAVFDFRSHDSYNRLYTPRTTAVFK